MTNRMTKKQYEAVKDIAFSVMAFRADGERSISYNYYGLSEAIRLITKEQAKGNTCLLVDHSVIDYNHFMHLVIETELSSLPSKHITREQAIAIFKECTEQEQEV